MKLTVSLVPSFLRLIRPEDIEERTRRFLERANLDDYFFDGTGAAWLEADTPGRMHVMTVGNVTAALLAGARDRAIVDGAGVLDLRLEPSPLSAALPGLGFRLRHSRVEYRTPLSELPDETGTPLAWRVATIAEAAPILQCAAAGDPDFDPDEDARACLESYMTDPVLTHAPECIQVCDAGIVIAQVNPRTAWSRITYMGLLPAFRGRGLGRWVHRRGFAMLRAQGGALYHGGTVETNRAMVRLFEAHGCRFYRRLEEWRV
jgi:GNAT superfamily N-acetyltransferase